jgi:integrating conjugative element protein (TIGR03755 family)
VGIGWNADMMCGNFDIDTTVRNQLNGITDGFQQLMGNVIQSATGAVASLPAMIIQRANPQLYDLLTNGVLQGRLDFDKSLLNCQKMAEKMTDLAADSAWFSGAKAENYQTLPPAITMPSVPTRKRQKRPPKRVNAGSAAKSAAAKASRRLRCP